MRNSIALLALAAFALAAPLHASMQPATSPGSLDFDRAAAAELPGDAAQPPQGEIQPTETQAGRDATGGMPDTAAAAAEAQVTACCWVFYHGRWWCVPCY